MIRNSTIASVALAFFANAAWSQQVTKEQVCEQVVPSMLEMVNNTSKISSSFNEAYDNAFDSEAKVAFAPILKLGPEIDMIFKTYREEFLKACYG